MWRALFTAVGIILVIVGLECLVVNRFIVAKEVRVPEFLAKMMGDEAGSPGAQFGSASRGNYSSDVAPPQYFGQGYGGPSSSMSQYGPSRLGSKYGNDRYNNSKFSLAGWGSLKKNNAQNSANSGQTRSVKVLRTKDWMPWSLIASGTIIFIYSRSFVPVNHASD